MNDANLKAELRTAQVGPWPMNSYALICPNTGKSVLVDPGADPDALEQLLADSSPIAILLTHSHPDHIGALDEMRQRLAVPVMAHTGPHFDDLELPADQWLEDGDVVEVGDLRLKVHYAPGHIGDQICFTLEDDHRVIVGDTIFEGGPGKSWTYQGFQTILRTLRQVVMPWEDDTICYPGHGPAFRLGDIRDDIRAFLSKDHGKFFGDATWRM